MSQPKVTFGGQQDFANVKKHDRPDNDYVGSDSDDIPLTKKRVPEKQKPDKVDVPSILQKYIDVSLAACKFQEEYPEAYEQVKGYVLTAQLNWERTKIVMISLQPPYWKLERMLDKKALEIPASLAEAVRVMSRQHMFTPGITAKMVSSGWDPALICHPTMSAKQRRMVASKEKRGVEQAVVDKCEDSQVIRETLAGDSKHGKLDGYVDSDLELVQQTQDAPTMQRQTNLGGQVAEIQRQLTQINTKISGMQLQSTNTHRSQMAEMQRQLTDTNSKNAELQHQSIDIFQSQLAEIQRQLTETNNKNAELQHQSIDSFQSQMAEMKRQSTNAHESQMAEMQRQLVTTHQSQMAEIQRQLTSEHRAQMAEMGHQMRLSQQSQMGDIQRQLARLAPSGITSSNIMSTNLPSSSPSGPDSGAYCQHYQPTLHGLPNYAYQPSMIPMPEQMGHYSPIDTRPP